MVRFKFSFIALLAIFQVYYCSFNKKQEFEEFLGFKIFVIYEGKVTEYKLSESKLKMDLIDLLARFSELNNPSMRFITTSNTIDVYEVDGIRNSNQKEWALYVNEKWISGETLKKGIWVYQDSKIELIYTKAIRIPLPRTDKF